MSEHHFGVGRGRIRPDAGERIDQIARRHGVTFTTVSVPGQGPSYWFSCPNHGAPFDEQTERAVWADLEAARLADTAGLLGSCFAKRRHT